VSSIAPMLSSADQTWNTPRWFVDRVEAALGPVGLDPCSNQWSEVRARVEYRLDRGQDGLVLPWDGLGLVYVNPPFGRVIGRWMQRCAASGAEVVALVPARVDAKWWHEAYAASSACRERSSELAAAATARTFDEWRLLFGRLPDVPLSTEVDASKVRRKRDPGRCFRRAGWELWSRRKRAKRRETKFVLVAPGERARLNIHGPVLR
jgi:hypothetical protein